MVRPFHIPVDPANPAAGRVGRIVRQVLALDDVHAEAELALVLRDFEARHWQTRNMFNKRYGQIELALGLDGMRISPVKQQLIGAYFCHEYSYAAAALMNPSIAPHPDQSGADKGCVRFVMSLRSVGEGHVSSIAFREGMVNANGHFFLQPEPPIATAAIARTAWASDEDGTVLIDRDRDSTLSGTVIFPVTAAQSNGLEDLRLTPFDHEDGRREWIGTYTAYSGRAIRSEMLRTDDFRSFALAPMEGSAAVNKGMALFPRKIDGAYMMIGRQDGKNLFLLKSDQLAEWSGGVKIMEPFYPWEFIQIGNCGAPIELDEGWLLLTHGVGPMRKYSIGAALLDKKNPANVLARTSRPLLTAIEHEREGYVPNVVYTCGALRLGSKLFLPYGLADSSVTFAFADLADILSAMD